MGVTPEELAQTYPRLYHMADAQSWESIRKHGLLSTSSLLDLFEVEGQERDDIETRRRPRSVPIFHEKYGRAVVRGNDPIIESKLKVALRNCTLEQWYRLLNKHVFFWLTMERLRTLLCARAYRNDKHAILTIETLPFVRMHQHKIVLSPMNSGNTQPIAHERSPETFRSMRDYPFHERAHRGEHYQIVELAVKDRADATESVLSVDLMRCNGGKIEELENIYRR